MRVRRLSLVVPGLVLGLVLAAGCSKDSPSRTEKNAAPPEAGSQPPPSQPPPAMVAPAAATATPAVVLENADMNATLGQLSLELRKYVVRTRTVPKTFEEFAANSRIQFPSPPAGKKYAIEGQAVVLVKR